MPPVQPKTGRPSSHIQPRIDRRGLLEPKLVEALREGYTLSHLRNDALAGLTVAILALPLSMAIAIGCGVSPDKGLVTTVVAGALISAVGGSRFQIGGPAAAFIVIVGNLIALHGYDGMLIALLMAGLILVAAGLLRLGAFIRYIPGPVVLGFTSGIGVLITLSQLKDFLGLKGDLPLEFFPKIAALWQAGDTFNPSACMIGVATLAAIVGLRHWQPRWPGLLIAVVGASFTVWAFGLTVETIGSRFGGIASSLPWPRLPDISWPKIVAVLSSAFTLAFLIGVESLLSAVVADTMAGTRHRSNMEILAQGVANIASALFGGLPATGTIARTGTNITAGAKTPVAGILHAVFVLGFMLLAAPLVAFLALPCLAAVLLNVSWRLIDMHEVRLFLARAPWDDRLVLLATFVLTVLVDLNVAIAVGVVLASVLFMHRMAGQSELDLGRAASFDEDGATRRPSPAPDTLPAGVQVFQFRGPLFFGAAGAVATALQSVQPWPRVLILRLREVPLIDMTALSVLDDLAAQCREHGSRIIVTGLRRQPRIALHKAGFLRANRVIVATDLAAAFEKARAVIARAGGRPLPPPAPPPAP
jgi:sulfate permease, SulP family